MSDNNETLLPKNNSDESEVLSPKISLDDSEKDKIRDLAYNEVLTDQLIILFGIFIALSFAVIGHTIYSVVEMTNDKSIPVVICPRNYELDAPVVMKTLKASTPRETDKWIRGFLRRYVTYQMPRKGAEVNKFFDYVAKHSAENTAVKNKYESMRDESKEIAEIVEHGTYYMFYPTSSTDGVRIREKGSNEWAVEVDGYLVKRVNGNEQRYTPTLKYLIKAGAATYENPEGLYVTEANIEEITDYVAGNTKKIN
jgi:hypothetical protein